jgi:hypothetical protein
VAFAAEPASPSTRSTYMVLLSPASYSPPAIDVQFVILMPAFSYIGCDGVVTIAWRELSRCAMARALCTSGCHPSGEGADSIPQVAVPFSAGRCTELQFTTPDFVIILARPHRGCNCNNVFPLYVTNSTRTKAVRHSNMPQWPEKSYIHACMAEMPRRCFNPEC